MMRDSKYELLRICLMLMIIAGHVMMQHKSLYSLTDSDEIIKLFLRGAFCVAVNSFILISGFFGIKFKRDRLIRFVIQTFFYSVVFMVLAIGLGWHELTPKTDIFAFVPVLTKQYWFVTCYIVLYVISPWLNIWVDSLEQTKFKRFLIVSFLIVYVWPTINFLLNAPQLINDAGYGIVNFVYLYMLGRYLHLYYNDKRSSSFYWGGYLSAVVALFLCQFGLSWMLGFEFTSWISYNTLFCFVGSVCLFMAFKNMTIHSRVINFWAKPCLAVYLIHMSPFILGKFCEVVGIQNYHGMAWLLAIFTLPFVIYFVCAIIEIVRQYTIGWLENRIVSLLCLNNE